eukprot:5860779-Pleurochrysis_carterae.AAC.1
MLSSGADVLRSLPPRGAFTVATGPIAHTPPAPLSSFAFSLPAPSPSQTRCLRIQPFASASTRFFNLSDYRLFLVVAAYPTLCERETLAN